MKLQGRTIVFGGLFFGGLLLIAWEQYYPKSEMLSAVGIPGPRAISHRQCDGFYTQPRLRILPRRMVSCRGRSYIPGAGASFDMVEVDALTRNVVGAGHGWVAFDSATWARQRDSVTRQLALRGGHEFKCRYAPELGPQSTLKYWRFRDFFIRESAFGGHHEDLTPWQLTLSATITEPQECTHPRASPEFDESNPCIGARIVIPVGFGKALCWKAPPWA